MRIQRVALAAALAIAVGAAAGGAAAATVVGAKSVRITNANSDWLQVAEVVALDFGNVNVALAAHGGVASNAPGDQYSLIYLPGADDGPDNANDGVTPYAQGYSWPGSGLPGIFHNGMPSPGSYLDITFAAPVTLSSLSIYGRTDCCGSRDLYQVDIRNAGGHSLFNGQVDARNADHVGTLTFDRSAGVPEPATWAMMIIGFGAAGSMVRRRRGVAA